MITARCPDCLSVGVKRGWQPVSKRDEEYTFVCSNLSCPRAREPWSVVLSRKQPFVLLGWDPREIVWLVGRIRGHLLAFGRSTIKRPRRLLGWVLNRSKFRDPRYIRVNGQWVHIENYQKVMGKLEEPQEASR
jgi:hypothetical protein